MKAHLQQCVAEYSDLHHQCTSQSQNKLFFGAVTGRPRVLVETGL